MTKVVAPAQDLQTDGYDVGEIPEDEGALMQSVLNDPEAKYNSADLNVAYKMKVDEYQKLCPYAEALEENWGKPPGVASACARQCRAPCLPFQLPGVILAAWQSGLPFWTVAWMLCLSSLDQLPRHWNAKSCMAMKASGCMLCK